MSTKQEEKHQAAQDKQDQARQTVIIGDHVLQVLGRPVALQRVQVRRLWERYYRVNVFVGPDAGATTVAHSYFLSADAEGNITSCTPALVKLY